MLKTPNSMGQNTVWNWVNSSWVSTRAAMTEAPRVETAVIAEATAIPVEFFARKLL
ncbi:hypothetical protein NBM05_04085 [Rothia sp. AR01]|uniref:Uncharacterized protein n=1 Tax=Rothia santali TaxID=2949643 RepID=A0A9X2H9N2_9MICC|nr:hypothetical protein [Rothia santali]MCP3425226.1 hypothetical protein [Rothia santali]